MAGRPRARHYDAIIVGAGFAGLYMLHRLREQGLSVRVLEAGDGIGGTWFWNRYPGARCDVPSLEYSYSFSKELQEEWEWTELMPAQAEVLRYLNHVADRFELRPDIQLETRVVSAHFDEVSRSWRVETEAGECFEARYCIMATGCLSTPLDPKIEGLDAFEGPVYRTSLWPKETVDFKGSRVAVIGTGSSGVQTIPVIAEEAQHLLVFQRTPTYTLPAGNGPLAPELQRHIKAHYAEVRQLQRASDQGVAGFGFQPAFNVEDKNILDLSEKEREEAVDELGFRVIRAFADVLIDPEANEIAVELYREKLRRVIDDPEVAEALSPRGYPAGCKRQVIDTHYYETFNRSNVTLVDLRKGAIECITPTGLRTAHAEYHFDQLVLAIGFDAMTGTLAKIDIRGREGRSLFEKWSAGPRAYLGLQTAGFPNLFLITGPGSPSVLSNMVVSIEQHVDWISDCIAHLRERERDRVPLCIEPTVEAEDAWILHVNEVAKGTMFTAPTCSSWYLGANVPGKPRVFMPYVGGVGTYREECSEIVAKGYEGFSLS